MRIYIVETNMDKFETNILSLVWIKHDTAVFGKAKRLPATLLAAYEICYLMRK